MLKILFVCLLLIINTAPVFTATKIATTQQPYYYNPYSNGYYSYPNVYSNGLSALEKYAISRTHGRENDLQRLERLENLAFGSIQTGDLATRYQNVEYAILSRPKYNGYRNSFRNVIGNYITGQATGVTPSIFSQNFMPTYTTGFLPQYTNSNAMQYTTPFGGRSYRVIDNNYGTNSSLRILP